MSYQIKENVIFRKELGSLIVLSPKSKKLFVFKGNFSNLVSDNGLIILNEESESVIKIINLLKKEEVI